MKTVENWEELEQCTSQTHEIKLDLEIGCGWIRKDGENKFYLSTHTFYESNYKASSKILQECGFDVQLSSWG